MHEKELAKMKELVFTLNAAARSYYLEDSETMSNLEYDRLYDELAALEEKTGVVFAGSPTQRVGDEVSEKLEKEEHQSPMLSLNKTKSVSKLAEFLGDKNGVLSLKLDGLTIVLTYEGGELKKALTRGDGKTGEIVTNNVRKFHNLPERISFAGSLTIRGESIIRYPDFEKINTKIDDVEERYKNPRNLAAGSVRQLDPKVTAERSLRFYAFQDGAENKGGSYAEKLARLEALGFETAPHKLVTAENVAEAVRGFSSAVRGGDLPADGLVLAFDDIAYGISLGATSKFPHSAIAFKWEDETKETKLRKVEWNTSRTGLINPVAIFDPVEIDGTSVSRASLHNISIMEELGLRIGSLIKVYKANMIIPQVAENLSLHKFQCELIPATCPVCGHGTKVHDADGIKTLRCENPDCPAKKLMSFVHFVSRNCMNIDGFSEKTLEKFIDMGFLKTFSDIFALDRFREEIVAIEGLGEKSYENLWAAIGEAKKTNLARLINALGIPGIGSATARLIARHFGERFAEATEDELVEIKDIGATIARDFVSYFNNDANKIETEKLLSFLTFDVPEIETEENKNITGKTFVITGSLNHHENRDALKEKIENLGGKVTSIVSPKTDCLINNDLTSNSSKNKKARELGTRIITEEEFLALIR